MAAEVLRLWQSDEVKTRNSFFSFSSLMRSPSVMRSFWPKVVVCCLYKTEHEKL